MNRLLSQIKDYWQIFFGLCKKVYFERKNKLKKIRLSKIKRMLVKSYKKASRFISDSWKPLVIGVPVFLFFYYFLGALISESINTSPLIKKHIVKSDKSQTIESMVLLLKREVDEHIWTPNLPVLFPAYILDNMPEFQIGTVYAVKDITKAINRFVIDGERKKAVKKAVKLLGYRPDVWLLSQKSSFSIAPSSNSQYRKARKELEKINATEEFYLDVYELKTVLSAISEGLQKMISENEAQVREFSSDYFDFQADNLFYRHKGYAFGLWQISEALSVDGKKTVLGAEAYHDWTILVANLQKAAEFKPLFVRNGAPDALFSPNHLIVQNYYLSAARAQTEKISNILGDRVNGISD